MIAKVFVVLGALLAATEAATIGCTIQMTTDIPKFEPIYLQPNTDGGLKLFIPDDDITVLPAKSQLVLACTGKGNTIAGSKQTLVKLQCLNDKQFVDESGKTVTLLDLSCNKIPDSDIVKTEEKCSNNRGFIYNIGFDVSKVGFFTSFQVCFDKSTLTTLYAVHTIRSAIKYSIKQSDRRAFRANEMGLTTVAVNNKYQQKNQVQVFEKMFGPDQQYISGTNNFIARGHLAPDADFLFSYLQMATYFYTNVAPEFQAVNAGNWLRIETLGRNTANKLKSDLLVHTGTIGTLELEGQKIYLDDKKQLNVPAYFYRVVEHKPSDSAIVFISSNNPYADQVKDLCPNVCDKANVDTSNLVNLNKGYSICCTLQDFRKINNDLPASVSASNLLVV